MVGGPIRCGAAALVAAVMVAGSIGHVAPTASAQDCAWQRHSKRIVKQLKRHGRTRQVKRVKHWWSCDPQPTLFTPAAVLPVPPAQTPPAEEPEPQAAHLGVKAVEWSYTLSRPEVDAGEVVVELNNQGEDPHNLKLEREGSEEPALEIPSTAAGSQASARFTLSAGAYRLYCSLFKHDAKGMEATLAVGDS